MNWQAIFFDFDGVILDSVDVKARAFAEMFRYFGPEIEAKVVAYHMKYGGISRHEKIRYWYKNYLNFSISEEEVQQLARQFSDLVLEKVVASPFVDGAMDALKLVKSNNIPAYVATGTPEDEIEYIVETIGINEYFDEVHGSPRRKVEIINDILQRKLYRSSECLFIGDSIADYWVAKQTGLQFLGIVTEKDASPFPAGTPTSSRVCIEL